MRWTFPASVECGSRMGPEMWLSRGLLCEGRFVGSTNDRDKDFVSSCVFSRHSHVASQYPNSVGLVWFRFLLIAVLDRDRTTRDQTLLYRHFTSETCEIESSSFNYCT